MWSGKIFLFCDTIKQTLFTVSKANLYLLHVYLQTRLARICLCSSALNDTCKLKKRGRGSTWETWQPHGKVDVSHETLTRPLFRLGRDRVERKAAQMLITERKLGLVGASGEHQELLTLRVGGPTFRVYENK